MIVQMEVGSSIPVGIVMVCIEHLSLILNHDFWMIDNGYNFRNCVFWMNQTNHLLMMVGYVGRNGHIL